MLSSLSATRPRSCETWSPGLARGPQKAPKPLTTPLHSILPRDPKWELLRQWAQPRQTMPNSSLQWAPALPPPAGQGPEFSSQHHLSLRLLGPAQAGPSLILSTHAGNRPRQVPPLRQCGRWPYPLFQSLPSPHPHAHKYHLHPSQLVFSHMGRCEPSPSCLLK